MQILECVPNVSEGRNSQIIEQLSDAIQSVEGVELLHTDSGFAANRTVFTFVGEAVLVVEAAFRLFKKASELIDMARHSGTHPRQGAVDVCPLIPLHGTQLETAIEYSLILAQKVSSELGIPIYLYEESARVENKRNLANLRKGEYESLPAKFETIIPDYGINGNWQKHGISTIGARKLLVAYNVNLSTKDVSIAKKIAEAVRESGKVVTDGYGKRERIPGKFKSVKGLGWYIEDFDKVQVSYNLTDIQEAGMLDVFLATKEEAEKLDCEVSGSELVGLCPLSELTKAGEYFNGGIPAPEKNLIHSAITGLGLSDITEFEPDKKIIEHLMA